MEALYMSHKSEDTKNTENTENNIESNSLSLNLEAEVNQRREDLVRLRRDFHQHPELSFKEGRTAQIVSDRLEQAGLRVRRNVGQTGVIGVLEGTRPGRTVMWRADMDALPIQENNNYSFISENAGVMHACGHDAHTAIGLTVADILAGQRKDLPGKVVFVFQPAEEIVQGALAMLNDGLMEQEKPEIALGLHVGSLFPAGLVQVKAGPMMAAVDTLELVVRGKGGHAAYPHLCVDTVLVACQIVVALQALVSREVAPTSPAVITFGTIQAGTKDNIIPDEARLTGTLRTFEPELRQYLLQRIAEMAGSIATAMRASAIFRTTSSCPAVINDAQMAASVRQSAERAIGATNVLEAEARMGSEDMSFFLEKIPGCFFNVGIGRPNSNTLTPHHTPLFDLDEAGLDVGVKVATQAILDLL
jgi:amidohydrolase